MRLLAPGGFQDLRGLRRSPLAPSSLPAKAAAGTRRERERASRLRWREPAPLRVVGLAAQRLGGEEHGALSLGLGLSARRRLARRSTAVRAWVQSPVETWCSRSASLAQAERGGKGGSPRRQSARGGLVAHARGLDEEAAQAENPRVRSSSMALKAASAAGLSPLSWAACALSSSASGSLPISLRASAACRRAAAGSPAPTATMPRDTASMRGRACGRGRRRRRRWAGRAGNEARPRAACRPPRARARRWRRRPRSSRCAGPLQTMLILAGRSASQTAPSASAVTKPRKIRIRHMTRTPLLLPGSGQCADRIVAESAERLIQAGRD